MAKQNKNNSEVKPNKDPYSAESVREWSLKILMESAEASLDISRCGDPEYIATLTPMQMNKLKRIVYGGKGNIVSVEPLSVVDFAVAAANIAGTREIAKQQAEKEKEKNSKHRSDKLELSVIRNSKIGKGTDPLPIASGDAINNLVKNIKQ